MVSWFGIWGETRDASLAYSHLHDTRMNNAKITWDRRGTVLASRFLVHQELSKRYTRYCQQEVARDARMPLPLGIIQLTSPGKSELCREIDNPRQHYGEGAWEPTVWDTRGKSPSGLSIDDASHGRLQALKTRNIAMQHQVHSTVDAIRQSMHEVGTDEWLSRKADVAGANSRSTGEALCEDLHDGVPRPFVLKMR